MLEQGQLNVLFSDFHQAAEHFASFQQVNGAGILFSLTAGEKGIQSQLGAVFQGEGIGLAGLPLFSLQLVDAHGHIPIFQPPGDVDVPSFCRVGSREEVEKATFRILEDCGQTGIMLGADCTVPTDIDDHRLEWVRQAAIAFANK